MATTPGDDTAIADEDTVFFASTAARPKDVLLEIESVLDPLWLSRKPKSLQGQVLFTIAATVPPDVLAPRLLELRTLDYLHVMLASCALNDDGDSTTLGLIRRAAGSVPPAKFEGALEMWRAVVRAEVADASIASLPRHALVFRALGKRGGKGHSFSSDEAKRAAKQGLTEATGCAGSTADFHFDLLAQVHRNRFWLGLRLNRQPLAPQPTAGTEGTSERRPVAGDVPTHERSHAERPTVLAPLATERSTAPASAPSALGTKRTAGEGDESPVLLSGWLAARMATLGLSRPRDARDAVTPLWEMPLAEQHEAKRTEMAELVRAKLATHGREAVECEPLRHAAGGLDPASADPLVPMRDVCDLHIGRDRAGQPCCGFRLGLGSGLDGVTVAPVDGVPIVPLWMVHVARELSAWLCEDGTQDELRFSAVRLRGSARTREAMALLTRSPATRAPIQPEAEARLARRLMAAAASSEQSLGSVLVRDGEGSSPAVLLHAAQERAGEGDGANEVSSGAAGAITEVLGSGLRLRISPLAFFQASTAAADVLFGTVLELVTASPMASSTASSPPQPLPSDADPSLLQAPKPAFPRLLLDLCCGGGVIGLEIARAAAACGKAMQVVGIELCEAAVADARYNAALNRLRPPEYTVLHAKAEEGIGQALGAVAVDDACGGGGGQDGRARSHAPGVTVVLDPPRTGLAPSVCKALRAEPAVDRVVFVSCNPHGHTLRHVYVIKGGSLAANAKILCASGGRTAPFQMTRAIPVDLFPHTPHVELCICFERSRVVSAKRGATHEMQNVEVD